MASARSTTLSTPALTVPSPRYYQALSYRRASTAVNKNIFFALNSHNTQVRKDLVREQRASAMVN